MLIIIIIIILYIDDIRDWTYVLLQYMKEKWYTPELKCPLSVACNSNLVWAEFLLQIARINKLTKPWISNSTRKCKKF